MHQTWPNKIHENGAQTLKSQLDLAKGSQVQAGVRDAHPPKKKLQLLGVIQEHQATQP